MNRGVLWGECQTVSPIKGPDDVEARVLRSRLVNLTLDWELKALSLDAQRYRTAALDERESLRDSANAYRKCLSELTAVLSASALLACKT
jgi:hypothetical protein